MSTDAKPLGGKAYGSIGHLPQSRLGPSDSSVTEGQAAICTTKVRDKHDLVIVQEKLDGSCVAAAKINGQIVALGRAGYLSSTSPYEQHHLWAQWVDANAIRFNAVLEEGERLCGEWLAQAHGTRYDLRGRDPFVAFDLMRGMQRATLAELAGRVTGYFDVPHLVSMSPTPVADALAALGDFGQHGAVDLVEGVVYRVERRLHRKPAHVDFLAKFVRRDKVDGCYLPEVSGKSIVWNWRPEWTRDDFDRVNNEWRGAR